MGDYTNYDKKESARLIVFGMFEYATKASLNEDIQFYIEKNLREQVLIQLPFIKNRIDDSIFLIQIYEEEEWTPDTLYTHIVAVEVNGFLFVPNAMITHTS